MINIFSRIIKRKFRFFYTLYINFYFFPFRIARKFPIFLFGDWSFGDLKGKLVIEGPVKTGMIYLGVNIAGYVATGKSSLRMKAGSKIIFKGKSYISQGCQIYLDKNATLELCREVRLGDSVKIICYKNIFIGERSEVTWECQVTDFNSHFIEDIEKQEIFNIFNPVRIGNFCWIGNRSTVMPGTKLPDRIIVSSNSLLNKDYIKQKIESYSLIGGFPAKLIKTGVKRIYPPEQEICLKDYFSKNTVKSVSSSILNKSI